MYMLFLGLSFLMYLGTVSIYSINERLMNVIMSHNPHRVRRELHRYRDPIALQENLNEQDELGQTVLARAVTHGHPGIVRQLLRAGANPNIPSFYENIYPLAAASFDGNLPVVQHLREAGGDPNAQDTSGGTVLSHAAYGAGTGVINYLLNTGADPEVRDNEGWSPLMHATYSGQNEALIELLEYPHNTFISDYKKLIQIVIHKVVERLKRRRQAQNIQQQELTQEINREPLILFFNTIAEHYNIQSRSSATYGAFASPTMSSSSL